MESTGLVTNGSGPSLAEHVAEVQRMSDQLVRELQELLETEERLYERLASDLAESKARRDRYTRALRDLMGEARKPAAKPVRLRADGAVFRPRQQHLDELVKVLRDGPLTSEQIIERVDFSHDVVRRGIKVLREEQQVRLAGRAGKTGRAYLYALMPDGA